MTTTDTFIRAAVEHCAPCASIERKYKLRKVLAEALYDVQQVSYGRNLYKDAGRLLVAYNTVMKRSRYDKFDPR